MSEKFYALRGEVVTCENGHPVCELARDVPLSDGHDAMLRHSDFVNWRSGEESRYCPVCGASFIFWLRLDTAGLMGPLGLETKFGPMVFIDGVRREPEELRRAMEARHEANVQRSLGG